jgi:hypothetical protein
MANDSLITNNVSAAPKGNIRYTNAVAVADIGKAMQTSKSIPTGYNGSKGKVVLDKATIKTTASIEGNDAGFLVEFKPVDVKGAKSLSLDIKGNIFQKQGWEHYGSIQVLDEDGKRYILKELCKGTSYEGCTGKGETATKLSDIKAGTSLTISLPKDLKTIQRFEVVFIGETQVDAGFTISNIQLVK